MNRHTRNHAIILALIFILYIFTLVLLMAHTSRANPTLKSGESLKELSITNPENDDDIHIYDVITNDPPVSTTDDTCKDVSVSIGYWTNRGKFIFY